MRRTPIGDNEIRQATEAERLASPKRDRKSGERIHPHEYDVYQLIRFVTHRQRLHDWQVLDACRRTYDQVDTNALRIIIAAIRSGPHNAVTKRRLERVETACNQVDAAVAIGRATGNLPGGPHD